MCKIFVILFRFMYLPLITTLIVDSCWKGRQNWKWLSCFPWKCNYSPWTSWFCWWCAKYACWIANITIFILKTVAPKTIQSSRYEGVFDDDYFLFLIDTICCDPSSEPSRRDGSYVTTYVLCIINKTCLNYHQILLCNYRNCPVKMEQFSFKMQLYAQKMHTEWQTVCFKIIPPKDA